MENLIIKKCEKCNAVIKYIIPCNCDNCNITCCNQEMNTLEIQTDDNSNPHVPLLTKKDKTLYITMEHEMDEEHYISNIYIQRDNELIEYTFNPEDEIAFAFPYQGNLKVYALCNKHGLWEGKLKWKKK